MRIVGWNIRAGGGRRAERIADQLDRWNPDIVALSEFRDTPASRWIADHLRERNLSFQLTTSSETLRARNGLLIASRWPLERVNIRPHPQPRQRCLMTYVMSPKPIVVVAVHGPLGGNGLRRLFNARLLSIVKRWNQFPGLVIGDTNTGKRDIDEESPVFSEYDDNWMDALATAGWPDAFRHLYPKRRAYTWYSPNKGNGFRLDEAFVQRSLLKQLENTRYIWAHDPGERRDAVSDHAAIIVDFRLL